MTAFLLMNFIVILSSFLLVNKLFKITNSADTLISLFILYFSQIVTTEIFLGILGILYLKNIILLNFIFLLLIWLITKNKIHNSDFGQAVSLIPNFLKNKIVLLLVSLILGFGLIKIAINLVNPPFGWDNLNYHFTFPVEWLKAGNLNNPITIFDDPSPSYYPMNGSLFFFWLVLPFKNVFLADLGQVPFFILAFLSVYSIARKLKLSREVSFYAAGLFFLIPNFFKQLEIAYVDVMVAALFLAALNFLFLLDKIFSAKYIALFSASLGLLLGVKTTALPYTILLLLPFIYLCFKNIRNMSMALPLSIIILIILGGFSYLRNFADTGNPLYPLDFKLFNQTIFKGVMDINTYKAHFKAEDYRLFKLLFHEGLGVQSIIFILPSILLALPLMLIKKRREANFNLAYFLFLPILVYFAYRCIIPLPNSRYLYPFLGIGTVVGFYTADILNIPKRIINILIIVCALTSIVEISNHQELIASIIFAVLLFFLLPNLIRTIPENKIIRNPLFLSFLSILIISALIYAENNYRKNEYAGYIKMRKYSGFRQNDTAAWDWLNRNTKASNVAYTGRPMPFPLYGTNFKNNVYYVSVNITEPAKLHYFPHSYYRWGRDFLGQHRNLEAKGNYRYGADYPTWRDNLMRHNTDYLFVYSLHQTDEIMFPLEDEWAKYNFNKFLPVFTNATIHIYKIVK